jgi:hypothetical protein
MSAATVTQLGTGLPGRADGDDSPSPARNGPAGSPTGTTQPQPPDPTRKLVIEGNKAWTVSGTVRQRWLADKRLARKTAPKEAMPFIASQLLTRPGPVRDHLGGATGYPVFTQLTGGGYKPGEVAAWPASRLPLALLELLKIVRSKRLAGTGVQAAHRHNQRNDPVPGVKVDGPPETLHYQVADLALGNHRLDIRGSDDDPSALGLRLPAA